MALEDLIRYESAAVAALNVEKDKSLSVLAMRDLYKNIIGKDAEIDPIYQRALDEAAKGGDEYGITNLGVAQAIGIYSKQYEGAFASTKISDIANYLTSGYSIPEEAKNTLGKYNDLTLKELAELSKEASDEDKEEIGKVMQTIGMLKERLLRERTMTIYNGVIKNNLEAMYPKQEEKE